MSDPHLNWYAWETFAGAEWEVYREMLKRGHQAWLGFYLDDVTRGRFKRGLTRIYIEGYVFVRADRKLLRDMRNIKGIYKWVENADGRAAPIADDVMDQLIASLSSPFKIDIGDASPVIAFDPGQRRKMKDGPFEGLVVEIAKLVDVDKIKVWMNAMGRTVEIEVHPGQLSHKVEDERRCA